MRLAVNIWLMDGNGLTGIIVDKNLNLGIKCVIALNTAIPYCFIYTNLYPNRFSFLIFSF